MHFLLCHLLAYELIQISSINLEFFICEKYHFLDFFFTKFKRKKACNPFSMAPSPEERLFWLFWRLMLLLLSLEKFWEGRGQSEPQEKLQKKAQEVFGQGGRQGKGNSNQSNHLNAHGVSARNEHAV